MQFVFMITLKFLVAKSYFGPWTGTAAVMKMPLNQWSSIFSTYRLTKSSQKRWRLSVAYLNLPITDFLFLCYLQQLFICSGSANHKIEKHRSGNSYCFSLRSINFANKKDAVYFRENMVSEVYQTLFCFHAIANINP